MELAGALAEALRWVSTLLGRESSVGRAPARGATGEHAGLLGEHPLQHPLASGQ
jgi:hypothetical protein